MIKLILATALSFCMLAVPTQAKTKRVQKSAIVLSSSNTIALRGPVTFSTVAQLQDKLISLSNNLPKRATIFLVLDTPGGSVDAGMALIDTAKGLPQRVVTITSFAASMGFITAQYLGPRIILPSGILMSHRARARVGGQVPGELSSRSAYLHSSIKEIEKVVAKRMKLSHSKYSKLILNEYWTYGAGAKAVKERASDAVRTARCDTSLSGTEKVTVQTFFGPVGVIFSRCPLVSAPLGFEFEDTNLWSLSYRDRLKAENEIRKPFLRKVDFLQNNVMKGDLGVYL